MIKDKDKASKIIYSEKREANSILFAILIIIPSTSIILIVQIRYSGLVSYLLTFTSFVLFSIASFLMPKVKDKIEAYVHSILFRGNRIKYDLFLDTIKLMPSILETKELSSFIISKLFTIIEIERVMVMLLHEDKAIYKINDGEGIEDKYFIDGFKLTEDSPLIKTIKRDNCLLIRDDLEDTISQLDHISSRKEKKDVLSLLTEMNIDIVVPLAVRNRLIGLLFISKKKGNTLFTEEEKNILSTLGNQFAYGIENAQLYESLKKSRQKMHRSDRLAVLGILTAGLANEIKDPLVSIKTFLQLLPERFNDEEFKLDFLRLTIKEVDKICYFIEELLSFARPTEPNFQLEDINQIVEKMLVLITNEVKKKNISINKVMKDGLPLINIDKEQIKQVLINIFLCLLAIMDEGGDLFVETRLYEHNKEKRGSFVQIVVSDTTKRLSKRHIRDIFNPFGSKKGTGVKLGLSIAQQIIKEHRGVIKLKNREAGGITFLITLPVNPISLERRRDKIEKYIGYR